jgi:hypothetical protein
MSHGDMLILDIIARMRHNGCGGWVAQTKGLSAAHLRMV